MNLIEDNPLDILKIVWIIWVELFVQDFSSHDNNCGIFIDANITSADSDVIKLRFEVSELLVRQSFDGSCEDSFGFVGKGQGDSILSNNSLTSWGMGRNEDWLSLF